MNGIVEQLLTEQAIAKTVVAFGNAVDAQDWEGLRTRSWLA